MRSRLKIFYGVIFTSVCLCATMVGGSAFAQVKFPTKPITIIVSWSAGGSHDLATRTLQNPIEKILGQPVIVINKTGGGATIGLGEVMSSAPDGYTLGISSPALFIVKYTIPKAGIDYVKFEPIMYVGHTPFLFLVKNDAPWNTWKEFYDYAKANPGKVSVGNGGYAAAGHIFSIDIERAAGVKFIHVPHQGTAPAVIDLLGGHIHAIVGGLTDVFSLIRGGKMKPLAVASDSRSKYIPEVPTFKELGIDIDFEIMWAFLGPKGIPKERVNILYNAFKKGVETKEFKDFIENQGGTISVKGPEEFGKLLQEKDKHFGQLITIGGIKPE